MKMKRSLPRQRLIRRIGVPGGNANAREHAVNSIDRSEGVGTEKELVGPLMGFC